MPQFNFQPIYSKYAGNTLAQEAAIVDKEQQKYDLGEQYVDTYEKFSKAMQSDPSKTSEAAVNVLRKKALEDIKGFVDKGNYNDIYNKIRSSAINLQSEYTPYAQNRELFQKQALKKSEDDKEWGNLANVDLQKQIEEYDANGGLKIDPSTGLATNYFNIKSMDKFYDVFGELNKILKDTPIFKSSVEGNPEKVNSYKLRTTTTGREIRTLNDLTNDARTILENTPHLKAVVDKQTELMTYMDSKQSVKTPDGKVISGLEVRGLKNNSYIDNQVKQIDNTIKELSSKLNTKESQNNQNIRNSIENLQNYRDNLQKSKLNKDQLNDFEAIKNSTKDLQVKNITAAAASLWDINNYTIKHDYLNDELALHREKAKIDSELEHQYDIEMATGSTTYKAEKIGDNYNEAKESYDNVSKSFNNVLKINQDNINKIPELKGVDKVTLLNIADAINKKNISIGGTSKEDIIEARKIIAKSLNVGENSNFLTDGMIMNMIGLAESRSGQLQSYENVKLSSNLVNNLVSDENLNKLGKETLTTIKNLIGNNASKEDIKSFIVKLKRDNLSIRDKESLLTKLTTDKNVDKGFWENVKGLIGGKEASKIANLTTYLNNLKNKGLKHIEVNDYTEENMSYTNPKEKSILGKANNSFTEALKTQGSINNLTMSDGQTIETNFKNGKITDKEGKKLDFKNFEFDRATMGEKGKINLTFKSRTKDEEDITVPVILNSKNGNVLQIYKQIQKDYIKSDESSQTIKDHFIRDMGKTSLPEQAQFYIPTLFDKNTDKTPLEFNSENGVKYKLVPLDVLGKRQVQVNIGVKDNHGNLIYTPLKGRHTFTENEEGDLYKAIGELESSF